MPQHLTDYWQILFARVERARERRFLRAARRGMSCCACAASTRAIDIRDDDSATRAERLDYIARFAKAGYFSAGPAVDLLQPTLDIRLD